ncbi:MAG TPA: RNB domain-containing ribonuclease [Bryobacteraceae bacterium]|jgi:exoribonuclease-2
MPNDGFDLNRAAHDEMVHEGFSPDFLSGTDQQIAELRHRPPAASADVRDLRKLLWSSIDNDTSRDLDQIEVAERVNGGIRVMVGIADVDSDVAIDSPIDRHASAQTTSVYTAVHTFPMLPEDLSTDLTSLNENQDRAAIVIEFVVSPSGDISEPNIYRALVHNRAQLTYNGVGPWLEGKSAAPPKVVASADLAAQLKLQDEAALALRAQRHRLGALEFDRPEPQAIVQNGNVREVTANRKTRANDLIEDFMVAANEVMAKTLKQRGRSSIRRVVKTPERWPRIVQLARDCGDNLPEDPDSGALNAFLQRRRAADPVHYPDLSLAVVKLMGPGEYVLSQANDESDGHFGLATHDYTHSTAPNRRFADLVTQRLLKAAWDNHAAPYSDAQLDAIARNCTLKEDAARKVERTMLKRVAAVALKDRIGETFAAVVTGVTPKGVFVRVPQPPVEGRVMRGEEGMDVGDQVRVKLLRTDPQRGFIDFGRA